MRNDPPRLAIVLVLALAAPALAGCVEDAAPSAGAEATAPGSTGPAAGAGAAAMSGSDAPVGSTDEAPRWVVGEHWTMKVVTPTGSETSDVVVVSAGASGYATATSARGTAVHDAMNDVSFLGSMGLDLSGRQGDDRVRFYQWPLTDGASWTTTWDGEEVNLTAAAHPAVPTPNGSEPGFVIEGSVGDRVLVKYNYAPSVRWWTRIEWPVEGFGIEVAAHGFDYAGSYYVGELRVLVDEFVSTGPTLTPVHAFRVDGVPDALQARFVAGALEPGAFTVAIQSPDGTPEHYEIGSCDELEPGGVCSVDRTWDLMPAEGEGHIGVVNSFNGYAHLGVRAAYVTEATLGAAAPA